MKKQFPRTKVGNTELSRFIIGTNFLLGWSHRSDSFNARIKQTYDSPEAFLPVLDTCMEYGIDAIMAPMPANPDLLKAIRMTEEKFGKEMVIIDTMFINTDDTPEGREEARKIIHQSKLNGTKIFGIHTFCVRGLLDLKENSIKRIGDYTEMIREEGMEPLIGAHMLEFIDIVDNNGYDFESYIQPYNCHGFMMPYEIEKCCKTIHNAKKPVMAIKTMAAGRLTPYVGLTWAWKTLRPQDMVTVGFYDAAEAEEDIEISFAALEGRFPDLPFNL